MIMIIGSCLKCVLQLRPEQLRLRFFFGGGGVLKILFHKNRKCLALNNYSLQLVAPPPVLTAPVDAKSIGPARGIF